MNGKRTSVEIIIPVLLALASAIITYISQSNVSEILLKLEETNTDFFTIIAILVGFNITSISLIAVFNKETLKSAFSTIKDEKEKETALRQLLSSFIYSVFIQIGVIVLGFFYNINIDNLLDIEVFKQVSNITKHLITYTLYIFWIAIIFHSIIVTIRNIILIYKFILVVYKS